MAKYLQTSRSLEVNGGMEALCVSIVIQAISDYQLLCQTGKTSMVSDGRQISKSEISKFLESEWCEALLQTIGGNFKGERLLEMLKEQEKEKEAYNGDTIGAYSEDGELIKTFKSLKECSEFAKVSEQSICKCLRGKRKTSGRYVWNYI